MEHRIEQGITTKVDTMDLTYTAHLPKAQSNLDFSIAPHTQARLKLTSNFA